MHQVNCIPAAIIEGKGFLVCGTTIPSASMHWKVNFSWKQAKLGAVSSPFSFGSAGKKVGFMAAIQVNNNVKIAKIESNGTVCLATGLASY